VAEHDRVTTCLALLASGLWGTSDFLGGTLSRRLPTLVVLAAGQAVALPLLLVFALVSGWMSAAPMASAALAGSAWALAMAAFYRALAIGTMGVVAPVAASGLVVPVAVGVASGDRPTALQVLGVLAALLGVVAAAGPELRRSADRPRSAGHRRAVLLALAAAVLFGTELALLAHAASGGVAPSLLAMRGAGLVCVLAAALARRTPVPKTPADLLGPAALGLLDLAATAAYAVAAASGPLAVVAVLASLYPAVTAILAHRLHRERLARVQAVGVAVVVGAAAVLGLGGSA